ncbi:MAG: hypothetical protein QOD45_1370 [Pseudonocardiales bacterium]|nr:hypothetical protein [Pseudonocardiales bacterium]
MLDVALRRADGSTVVDPMLLRQRTSPPLNVSAALRPVLPDGLRRGSTVSVTGSVSLLLALLGAASADGAWCALVGFPLVSAEATAQYGIELRRLALVPTAGSAWTTAVGALLDAVDIVAVRPPAPPAGRSGPRTGLASGDARRLAARARSRDAVLIPFLTGEDWPGADVRLRTVGGEWTGLGSAGTGGSGRLRARRVTVTAEGRGTAARPRSVQLWLPRADGSVAVAEDDRPLAPVVDLAG